MTIHIEKEVDRTFDFDYEALIEQVIIGAMDYENCPYEAEVEVLLTDDASIAVINEEQRSIARPTDVLSFPMIEYDEAGDFSHLEDDAYMYCFNPESGELVLGDIIISVDKVYEQAEAYGHSTRRELAFLVAHSMLHLFGYDHMVEAEASVMEAKQREILEQLNITRED